MIDQRLQRVEGDEARPLPIGQVDHQWHCKSNQGANSTGKRQDQGQQDTRVGQSRSRPFIGRRGLICCISYVFIDLDDV